MKTELVERFQTVCCECGRARVGDRWYGHGEVDLTGAQVTHGYCPPCFDRALMKLMRMSVEPSAVSLSRAEVVGS